MASGCVWLVLWGGRGTCCESIVFDFRAIALQIQKMVISGGDFKPDTLKAKDMVSLLLHDDEMESRCAYKLLLSLV